MTLIATHPTTKKEQTSSRRKLISYNARINRLGYSIYSEAGALSAYQSFRYAVANRPESTVLQSYRNAEKPSNLLFQPFNFTHLLKLTTYLALFADVGFLYWFSKIRDAPIGMRRLNAGDYLYNSLSAHSPGVGEEAVFRGWLLPCLDYYFDNALAANLVQGLSSD